VILKILMDVGEHVLCLNHICI